MKFSIIVPAYNVAQYIEECVESVLNQDYDNYEVIVIDDGATDETPQIIDSLAQKSEKVKVIHQKNGGLSAARNSGIEAANGDYIIFLDGDDFWSSQSFLNDINNRLNENSVDVIIYSYSYHYTDKIVKKTISNKGLSGNIKKDCLDLVKRELITAPAWNKCVKRTLFADGSLDFQVGFLSEDCLWCANLLKLMTSYAVFDNAQYMYRQNRAGSITNVVKEKNVLDILKSISIGLDNIEKLPFEKQEALTVYFAISYISILPFVHLYKNNFDIKNYLKNYEYLLQYSRQIENKSFKYTGLVAKGIGVEKAAAMFNKLLGLYKKFKKLGIIKS
ncbi:glycosyltransferase family 2 protein [Streptococcus infantarius]|uniref:glycosyltransferase family 2 protein n=1 Tax=Streptococcus infantarius TaxID=102684 RepID=UPI0022DFBCFA|nr:glycosyltransferase family 2 protein [Streptococcus infantarius]